MDALPVDVWSDIACPWCYVGKRRLEAALARFPHREQVRVTWRAFELDPSAPPDRGRGVDYAERLARKYGTGRREAEGMIARMVEVARTDGLELRFDIIRPGNTFDAHRLVHLAGERGCQDAVKERLLRAYLCEGALLGSPEALARLAVEAGLDGDEVAAVLSSDQHARAVRHDEEQAHALGIHGVPFFGVGRYGLAGAQPPEEILATLERAWSERA